MSERRLPRIWALLGPRTGDNNQVLALAEALGLPFETRTLQYNLLRRLDGRILGRSLVSLDPQSRRQIAPPWPDLIIAIGRRSVPVARWIQRANHGRTKLVRIGNPRMDPALFDLVITTRQYPVPPGNNVILLPIAMSRYRGTPAIAPDEEAWFAELPRPHLLMAVGGATKYWKLAPRHIADAAGKLSERSERVGGSLIAVSSPRTDPAAIDALRAVLDGRENCRIVDGNRPRFPVLLDDADECFVTGDSVSMISEAILTGKPVGLIQLEMNRKGRRRLRDDGFSPRHRDLRRFWSHLEQAGLIGTLAHPVSSQVHDPVTTAASAVLQLLGDFVEHPPATVAVD